MRFAIDLELQAEVAVGNIDPWTCQAAGASFGTGKPDHGFAPDVAVAYEELAGADGCAFLQRRGETMAPFDRVADCPLHIEPPRVDVVLDNKIDIPVVVQVEGANTINPHDLMSLGGDDLCFGRLGQGQQTDSGGAGRECIHVELTMN